MGNEEQQLPPPQQGSPDQQPYYGWQYDQDHAGAIPQQPPADPQLGNDDTIVVRRDTAKRPRPPTDPQPPVYTQPALNPSQLKRELRQQQPVSDMGSSLGYGQGTEYQYYTQPSQPLPVLRQTRLQQLRDERLRRQQSSVEQDNRTTIRRKAVKGPTDFERPRGFVPQQTVPAALPVQVPPILPGVDNLLEPAAVGVQDTGIIQRQRIGHATMILTGAFVASRILGLLRTSMFAFVFGTTSISDAYVQAFLVPDLIFNIVAGGALSSAFIPVFVKYVAGEKDEKTAWHIASTALNLAIIIMIGLATVAIIFARQIVPIYNPGEPPAQLDLITSLTRIMLLQAIILGGGVIVTAVLQARQNFLLAAVGTVLYNVGIIIGLLPGIFLAFQHRGSANDIVAVYAATGGVVLGAILQVAIQIPGLRKVGMHYSFAFDWHHPGVIQIGRQMVPRVINAAMLFSTTFVDRYLLSFLGAVVAGGALSGLITQYYQAFQIFLLPLGIFGMAVSTAAFPTLADYVARGRMDRLRNTILETLRGILFMSIPSSIGLIVLSLPIIQVLLEHGHYTLINAQFTAIPLAFFAVGLSGHASVEILTRSFYALRDSRTPVIISIAQFIFKIALSLILINAAVWGVEWGMGGLAISTSIAGLLEAIVLVWLLHERIGGLQLRALGTFIGRVLLASLAMGLGVLVMRFLLDMLLVTTDPKRPLGLIGTLMAAIKLLLELGVGAVIYLRIARLLHIEELNSGPIRRLLNRLKLSWL